MVMMWVFVGIEGASVLANRAKKRSEAQQASIIGLLCLLFIYILASILPYGVLSQEELATISQPAMANILKGIVDDAPSRNNDVDGSRRSVAERLGKNE